MKSVFLAKSFQGDQLTHSAWWTAREKTWWRSRCSLTALPFFCAPSCTSLWWYDSLHLLHSVTYTRSFLPSQWRSHNDSHKIFSH